MKKHIVIFTIIGLLLLVLPLIVNAEIVDSGSCGENVTWTLDDEGLLTISGDGDMYDYSQSGPWSTSEVKQIIIDNGVTSIGSNAFNMCRNLTNVILPDSLTNIAPGAFSYCSKLNNIVIPDNVTSIGDGAFYECNNMVAITIPNDLTDIGMETNY